MFRSYAWLAASVPALAAAWALAAWAAARREKFSAAIGTSSALARAAADATARRRPAALLRLAALALLFAALAGPQWGVELLQTRTASRQVVVAVDVSLSMSTPDVKPTRLERAKASLSLLLDQLKGARVGVVAFAGDAQIVCPLTSDVEAAKLLLNALEVGAVPVPGTAIGTAIRTSSAMLGRYPGEKALVLLTDGEDHKSDPAGAAREAAAAGVRVYAVGIGTPEGEPIPVEGGGYKKDAKGGTVVSRLGEDALSSAASATGGAYYRTTPGEDEIADIATRVNAGAAAGGIGGTAQRWQDRYAWPLGAAFLLLLAEMLLPLLPARAPVKASVLLALLAAAAVPSRAALFEGTLREGNKLYRDEKYDEALEKYGDASARRPSDPRPVYNAGDALYRLERSSDAAGAFGAVAERRDAPRELRAASYYNLGNARYGDRDYAGAADAYRRALALAPGDPDARRNLAIALRSQKNPPPKNDKKKDKDQDKKDGGQKPQDQNDKNQDKSGGQTRSRPQDSLTREEAERVMRAVAEREKSSQKKAGSPAGGYGKKRPTPKPPTEEDW